MNYSEAVDWLYSQLPMFQRIGAAAYKNDLTNTIKLCDYFNQPQQGFKSIHVAGTNGKGSTSHMLASILQESGYKVGLYTSPHLKSFTERIKINGEDISQEFITDFVTNHKDFFSSFDPSFFEITVAMAFVYFRKEKVDVAVIETGLGGRLDSTNVITPELSVITNIGYDHMSLLGDTLEKIAFEKAGIIKPTIPIVIGETLLETKSVFIDKSNTTNSRIIFAENNYSKASAKTIRINQEIYQEINYDDSISYTTDQLGLYQQKNLNTVLVACEELQEKFPQLSDSSIRNGLMKVKENTQLLGRWQILQNEPLCICDVGHNKPGIELVLEQLKTYRYEKLHWVIGFVNDKDVTGIISMLPKDAYYYFTQANIPRAMKAEEVAVLANSFGLQGEIIPEVASAFEKAKQHASNNDLVFVGGSSFVVAEVV